MEEEAEVNEQNGNRRFCAEEPLPGPQDAFKKFSNNAGYWNQDETCDTLLRFTLFTYRATNGCLLVSDLLGVRKGRDFYLTDPVLLCTDCTRFGSMNLGEPFMKNS